MSDTSRRAVLAGAVGLTTASVLAACGDDKSNDNSGGDGNGGGAAQNNGSTGGPLAKTGDVPVNGGKILGDQDVVITQPQAGTFKAFTATCTHQQCTVAEVAGGTINCKCHGSKFSATDGSVKNGPATKPLTEKQIKVDGDSITLA